MDDKLYIHIETSDDGDMFDDIKSLGTAKDEIHKPALLSDLKKSKKDKKKKDKSSTIDIELNPVNELSNLTRNDIIEIIDNTEEEDYDIGENIIDKEKRNYKGLKKSNNDFEKRFAEEITLLYNLLSEVTSFGTDAQKRYKEMMNRNGVRGINKYSTDFAQMILASHTNRLNIIKELSSIKKSIVDLGIKSDKAKGNNDGDLVNRQHMAASFLQNILQNRAQLQSPPPLSTIDDYTSRMSNIDYEDEPRQPKNYGSYANIPQLNNTQTFNNSGIESYLQKRLDMYNPQNDEYPYMRSNDGNMYIQNERYDPKIVIDKNADTNLWEFVAIDANDNVIEGYPLPKKSNVKVKFSEDGKYASDQLGNVYTVRNYTTM